MCGAISIQYDPALREELTKFLSEDEIRKFERNGEIVFAYWDKRPLLPVRYILRHSDFKTTHFGSFYFHV